MNRAFSAILSLRAFFALIIGLLLPLALSAESTTHDQESKPPLAIHLLPDSRSPALASLPLEDLQILSRDAVPLEESLYKAGWRGVQFPLDGTFYVKARHIGKDFSVALDSPVYLQPEDSLDLLITIVEADDRIEVLHLEKSWGEIHLQKVMRGFAYHEDWQTPAEDTTTELPLIGFLEESEPLVLEDVTAAQSSSRRVINDPNLDEGFTATMRMYDGFLRRTRRFLGRGPTEPYALYDLRGRRIAVLNTDRLLLTTSIEKMVGRPVKVQGILRMSPTGNYSVIDVESLRVR